MVFEYTLSLLNSVQEEAINSGKFELLSDSLKQSLSVLKDYTKSRNSILDKAGMFNFKNDNITTSLYMSPKIPDHLSIHPLVPAHPEFLLTDVELSTLVKDPKTYLKLNEIYLRYIADEVWIKHGILNITNKTIELIDNELNN